MKVQPVKHFQEKPSSFGAVVFDLSEKAKVLGQQGRNGKIVLGVARGDIFIVREVAAQDDETVFRKERGKLDGGDKQHGKRRFAAHDHRRQRDVGPKDGYSFGVNRHAVIASGQGIVELDARFLEQLPRFWIVPTEYYFPDSPVKMIRADDKNPVRLHPAFDD